MKILLLVAAAVGLGAIMAGNVVPDISGTCGSERCKCGRRLGRGPLSSPGGILAQQPSNQSDRPGYGDQTSR